MADSRNLGASRLFGEIVGILHALEAAGASMTIAAVADAINVTPDRAMYLLDRLASEGAVTAGTGGSYTRVTDHIPSGD